MDVNDRLNRLGRLAIVTLGLLVAIAAGWIVFWRIPETTTDLLGILLILTLAVVGVRVAGQIADTVLPDYNVAEVTVVGPITRQGGRRFPTQPGGIPADVIVEQIENADADTNTKALILKLNTPGGEVVPSDDIRKAAHDFDGPTVAYVTDRCASGGYWIASGCDEIWARDTSIVGSIGVIGSTLNAQNLANRLGITYERLAAGKYKDAGFPLKELSDDERIYLQGIIDSLYDQFVERIVSSRDLDRETVRGTEARVFLGSEAREQGLIDNIGTREDVEDHVESLIDQPVRIRKFEPPLGLTYRLREGVFGIAFALGSGVASTLGGHQEPDLQVR